MPLFFLHSCFFVFLVSSLPNPPIYGTTLMAVAGYWPPTVAASALQRWPSAFGGSQSHPRAPPGQDHEIKRSCPSDAQQLE